MSKTIGDTEVENNPVSVNSSTKSTNTQYGQKVERAVLASELAQLPDRHGFLNIAGMDWIKIIVPNIYSKLPVKVKAFMSKRDVAISRASSQKTVNKTSVKVPVKPSIDAV